VGRAVALCRAQLVDLSPHPAEFRVVGSCRGGLVVHPPHHEPHHQPHSDGTGQDGEAVEELGHVSMTEEVRRDVLLRLRKVGGQVQGIAKMVEDDRYCVDVLQQLSAVTSAVESVSKVVVRNYLERCVTDAINGGDPLIYDELMRVVFKHR
jgi:DNA-binding FrmR family transcriptional regulator